MALTKILAANLRALREMHGRLGQLELAQRVGVSRRTIARLENAEVADPGIEHIRALASTLGVPFELLVTRSLSPITLALPEDLHARLQGEEGPALLRRIVQALDDAPR